MASNNVNENNEMKISASLDSLICSDQVPTQQNAFTPNLIFSNSLDNIILDPSINEDNISTSNEILNESENMINELESLIIDSQNMHINNDLKNISNINDDIHFYEKLTDELNNDLDREILTNYKEGIELQGNFQQDIQMQNIIDFYKQSNQASVLNSIITNISNEPADTKNEQVTFKEEKGLGLIDTDSSANLVKFFSDPSGFGSDNDGRKFFDSFTSQSSPKKESVEEQNFVSPPLLESNLEPFVNPQQDNLNNCFMSEESIFEAWIPSDSTRQILYHALTTNILPPQPISNLCLPGIIIEESLGDPIYELIKKHLGEQEARKRLILTADSVPQDVIGLQQLIKADCLRAAVDLTNRLIEGMGQGVGKINQITTHTPHSLQLWFCRFSLLCRLQLFTAAECEWEAFKNLDTPDLYFEFHQSSFPNKRGSMVPFRMRILHAEFPQYVNKPQDSVDRLCYMYAVIQQMIKNLNNGLAEDGSSIEIPEHINAASKKLWLQREVEVLHSLANYYLSTKDYLAAMDIYKILLTKCTTEKEALYSAMARLSLQVGDIEFATKYYDCALDVSHDKSGDSLTRLIHRGMLEMGNGRFEEAYILFKNAAEKDPRNVTAINNKAVCALYIGRLKEALQLYESIISIDPSKHLLESIVLNLCTLYELEASRTNSKKLNLLRLIGQYKATGFNITCLKIPD